MRKFYTIEDSYHTNRKALIEMVARCVGNRKSVDQKKILTEKKIYAGRNSKKNKLGRANT